MDEKDQLLEELKRKHRQFQDETPGLGGGDGGPPGGGGGFGGMGMDMARVSPADPDPGIGAYRYCLNGENPGAQSGSTGFKGSFQIIEFDTCLNDKLSTTFTWEFTMKRRKYFSLWYDWENQDVDAFVNGSWENVGRINRNPWSPTSGTEPKDPSAFIERWDRDAAAWVQVGTIPGAHSSGYDATAGDTTTLPPNTSKFRCIIRAAINSNTACSFGYARVL